jgi:hypothetical protein
MNGVLPFHFIIINHTSGPTSASWLITIKTNMIFISQLKINKINEKKKREGMRNEKHIKI